MTLSIDQIALYEFLTLSHSFHGSEGKIARLLIEDKISPSVLLEKLSNHWKEWFPRKSKQNYEIHKEKVSKAVSAALNWEQENTNHTILTLSDNRYPILLKHIPDPPLVLYVKGDVTTLSKPSIAVVGSRNPTTQGADNAYYFSKDLGNEGYTIVSGLALGIDTSAHLGSLESYSASTIAVLGTGIDFVYPNVNKELATRIIKNGAIISEFPIGTPPIAANFPKRNRIIAGCSQGCLIVEATLRSGSLVTGRLALDYGREIFAIPGSIHSPQSKGCHSLIKQGAKLVENTQDILEEFGQISQHLSLIKQTTESPVVTPAFHSLLLKHMGFEPCQIDWLCEQTQYRIEQITEALLLLELEGKVTRLIDGRWVQTIQRRN
jgi:DNA processing protein